MSGRMRDLQAFVLGASVMVGTAGAAGAAEVTLKMKGGDFSVTGDLVAYDGGKYTIQSKSFGSMTLDGLRFECEGGGCPKAGGAIVPAQVAALNRGAQGTTGKISVTGSNTIGNQLMPALIQAYAQTIGAKATKVVGDNPLDVQFKIADAKGRETGLIELHRHGSTTAFAGFEKKTVDIGMSSRPVKPEEAAKLAALGLGDMRAPSNEHVIGLDGLLILVSASNSAVSLSLDTIAKVFAGVIKDWSELGLPAGPIQVYSPEVESGTGETFETLVMKPRNLKMTDDAKRTENYAELSDQVATDPNGIGIAGIAYQRNAKALNIETSCGLISRPSAFVMKTEEYPLTRRLFLYSAGDPREPLAKGLLNFALSAAAQPVIRQNDFIDQAPEPLNFQAQTTRIAYALNAPGPDFDLALMKTLISDFKPANRLTTTFRFESATFALDTKASADVGRLRTLLEQPEYAGKTVILAGFADGVGRFDNNLTLSQRRAQAVLAALQRAGTKPLQVSLVTKAYSQLAPVACNDTLEARRFNRRVEIWIK